VGAVRADCEDVLQKKLLVALTHASFIPRVLDPEP
jgi:hypothetical protein